MMLGSIGPREEYQPVEIRIFAASSPDTYPAELTASGWRSFPPTTIHIDRAQLLTLETDPRGYGQMLGQALFGDQALGQAYHELVAACQGRGSGLRVRLRIDAPELYALHWERIFHPIDKAWHPLGMTASTPFSRVVLAQQWDRPMPVTERPLRALVVIAAPNKLNEFNLDPIEPAERQALHAVLDALPEVTVSYLETGSASSPTLDQLRQSLVSGFHLVHFLCHGAVTEGGTVLFLEDQHGGIQTVEAAQLVESFKVLNQPPLLCFLAACQTGVRGRSDAFMPLGPALVASGGVQAAIAMSDRIGITTAQTYTKHFYTRLLIHGVLDLAVNEARVLVQDTWDWGVPVLFSRLHDNQLIDFPVAGSLSRTSRAIATADQALNAIRQQGHGQELVSELERLMQEFRKSYQVLVDQGSAFRATGADQATFAQNFAGFYVSFKAYYDSETWSDEEELIRALLRLRAEMIPRLAPLLDNTTLTQLQTELDQLEMTRRGLVTGFGEYLETMNGVVDQIKEQLDAGAIDAAIASKRTFEAQISPSLRASKALIQKMSSHIGNVQAA